MTLDTPSTPERETIEDHRLLRRPHSDPSIDLEFIEPYLLGPKPHNWQCNTINAPPPDNHHQERLLNSYAVSLSEGAYVTICVALTDGDQPGAPRFTEMLYRDMTADNYRAAVAAGNHLDLQTLRFLGVKHVTHQKTRNVIEYIFTHAGMDWLSRGSRVEVTPQARDLDFELLMLSNPFTRGQVSLLRHYNYSRKTGGSAYVKRVIFISEGYDGPAEGRSRWQPMVHIVTELGRPSACETVE
ncbi:Uu.00g048820.m01.CDS01 [Anthostomella pinea]|uniref:Uu.00g048820.m01.CDS01 n=1 Tax=Anthostomella pinea TaxID=933095 RepID=A0AAI8VBP4_9PEZI|nr:Uu.00g048820.m01.CDS01 [Anthostomella pinea]